MKLSVSFYSLAFALLLFSTTGHAQIFRLKVISYGSVTDPTLQAFVDSEIAKIETQINKDMPSNSSTSRLMEGMANSSVMAGKGIGKDYASNMDVFLIGAGLGVGADLTKDENVKSDLSGAAVAPGIVIGTNLSFLDSKTFLGMDTDRLNLYFNFMNYTHEQTLNDKENEKSSAKLDMMALGVHFKYDWIKKRGSKWLGWGGVKFHFGYEYNKNDITFNSQFNKTIDPTTAPSGDVISAPAGITGDPKATINTSTHSIPLELSTDIQLLYFLSIYTGLGLDYNVGKATGKGALNSSPSNVNCSGGPLCGGGQTFQVQGDANLDGSGKPNPFTYRGFAGVQFNLPFIRVFGQVDKAFGNNLIGATAGVRFVY